jgi:hypothetical protein
MSPANARHLAAASWLSVPNNLQKELVKRAQQHDKEGESVPVRGCYVHQKVDQSVIRVLDSRNELYIASCGIFKCYFYRLCIDAVTSLYQQSKTLGTRTMTLLITSLVGI